MPQHLRAPEAQTMVERVRALLQLADDSFKDSFTFHTELLELPDLIAGLQQYVGRKKVQTPFWDSVRALDGAAESLVLVPTLDAMVARATSINPGPLFVLRTMKDAGQLKPAEAEFVERFEGATVDLPIKPREDLRACQRLFDKAGSATYLHHLKLCPRNALGESELKLVAYAGALDVWSHHRTWIDRYWPSLESLYDLLFNLENEDYFRSYHRVVHLKHGCIPTRKLLIDSQKQLKAAFRQQRRRYKGKEGESRPLKSVTKL